MNQDTRRAAQIRIWEGLEAGHGLRRVSGGRLSYGGPLAPRAQDEQL